MLDLSWGEIMVVGAVALIVIGPKDLPKALRTLGKTIGQVRRMAGEFQSQFAEAMREAELDDVRKQIQGMNETVGSLNPVESIRSELKSAVEGTGSTSVPSLPSGNASVPASEARNETSPAPPAESPVALPSVSVPPVDDPTEAVGRAVGEAADLQKQSKASETESAERTTRDLNDDRG
jgi:sec-independent protein translocase protein TatB